MLRAGALRAACRIGTSRLSSQPRLIVPAARLLPSFTQTAEYATAKAKVQTKKKNAVPTLFAEAVSEVTAEPVKAVIKESKYIYGVTDEMLADADETTKAIYSLENASRPEQNKAAIHAALDRAKTWEKDTGSPQAQVAVLTTRIHYMITHMREHPKDVHSRRGLEAMVQKRRSMLLYLRKKNLRGYLELLRDLGLKPLVTPKSSKFR